MSTTYSPQDIEKLAHKRANALMGWTIHAAVYIAVNFVLITISTLGGKHWAVLPALGWGLGLALHGVGVLLHAPLQGLRDQLVQRERNRLSAQRDPW